MTTVFLILRELFEKQPLLIPMHQENLLRVCQVTLMISQEQDLTQQRSLFLNLSALIPGFAPFSLAGGTVWGVILLSHEARFQDSLFPAGGHLRP